MLAKNKRNTQSAARSRTAIDAGPINWTIEPTHTNVATIRLRVDSAPGFEHWTLLRGDAHHDNPKCNRELEYLHLDQARKRGAAIVDVGDLFCAMQGKYDKRSSKSDLRPEHQCGDYLDALVRTAAEDYKPYARNWAVMGVGNHESSIKNRHETDLTERLVERLRGMGAVNLHRGGYTGWVRYIIEYKNLIHTINLAYCHGWGGGGEVTMNTIQLSNRYLVALRNADIVVGGHTHWRWYANRVQAGLCRLGKPEQTLVHIVQVGSYKNDYGDGSGGWHVETGKSPRPMGGYWLRLTWCNREPRIEVLPTECPPVSMNLEPSE